MIGIDSQDIADVYLLANKTSDAQDRYIIKLNIKVAFC